VRQSIPCSTSQTPELADQCSLSITTLAACNIEYFVTTETCHDLPILSIILCCCLGTAPAVLLTATNVSSQ